MKLLTFRFPFISVAVAGKIAKLRASSLFLCCLVSNHFSLLVNAAHLTAAATLCRQRRVVFVEDLNSDRLHLPGGALPTLKTWGDDKGPK